MPAQDLDLSGSRFGGYDLLELIGRGGMGLVYRANQRNLDREVALKVLAPHLAENRKFIQRFVREARAAGRLSHPNVVQGYDVGEVDGRYFFAMELVDGETLYERLRRDGPIDEALAVRVLRKVADALAHAAGHGIVHRDIKPDNILMGSDGEPKLADLGLAKVERRERDDDEATDSQVHSDVHTEASKGVVLGTAAYIAPEQARAERGVDTRADLYSLGMSIYHLLTGSLPFPADNRTEMLAHHLETPMPDVRELAPKVSTGLAAILQKLGEKDPDDRPESGEELIEALDAAADGRPLPWETAEGQLRRRRAIARRRRRKAVSQGGVAVAAVVVIVAGGLWAFGGSGGRARRPRRTHKPTPAKTAGHPPDPSHGETAPPPAPTPKPPPPPPDRDALDAALAWAKAHPDDLPGAIERLRAAAAASHGSVRNEARSEVRALERRLKARVAAAATAFRGEAEALINTEQFAKAAAKLAAAPAVLQGSSQLQELADRLDAAAQTAFDSVRQTVDDAQQQRDWRTARDALEPVLHWGVASVVDRAQQLLSAVKRMEDDWNELKRASYEMAVARRTAAAVRDRLAQRDPAGALAAIRTALQTVKQGNGAEALQEEAASATDAQALVAAVAASGRLCKGRPITVGRLKGEIIRIENGELVLKLRSGSVTRPLADLDAAAYLDLARAVLDAGAKPPSGQAGEVRAGWVVLALAAGDAPAAQSAYEAGEWAMEVDFRLQNRLQLAPRLDREVAAYGLLAAAEAAVVKRDAKTARAAIEKAEFEYSDTEAVQGAGLRRRDIERALEKLEAGTGAGGHEPGSGGQELPGGG